MQQNAMAKPAASRKLTALLTVAGLSLALLTSGCSGGNYSASEVMVTPAMAPGVPMPQMEFAADDTALVVETMAVNTAVMRPIDVGAVVGAAPIQADREIIVTGWTAVRVDDPIAAASSLVQAVESAGGFVASRSESPAVENRAARAWLQLRVPAHQMNFVIETLNFMGEVENLQLDQQDVTAQAVDLDARIAALEVSITRLTELLATAGDTGELLQVEQELTRRQSDFDALRAQRASLTDRVAFSTLDVELLPTVVAIREAEPSPGFLGGLRAGWEALASFGRGLLVVLGAILPWLIPIALIVGLLTWLLRALRRRRAAKFANDGDRNTAKNTTFSRNLAGGGTDVYAPKADVAPRSTAIADEEKWVD